MNITTLQGATVLITGGTGTFGNAFLDECLAAGADEIRIFSRDEKKQYDMAQRYRENRNVRFFLGDIRDKRSIDAAMYGVDFVFHAAAMKQVPSCENFPMEAVKTNISGSENLLLAAIQKRVQKVVCLSTDKAVYPTSAMGMTKAYMEKLAFQKAEQQSGTEICVTRFGNLVASRGSAVPLFIEQVQNGMPITITDPAMTRFMMTVKEAVALVRQAFAVGRNGELLVKRSAAWYDRGSGEGSLRIYAPVGGLPGRADRDSPRGENARSSAYRRGGRDRYGQGGLCGSVPRPEGHQKAGCTVSVRFGRANG